MSAAHLIAPPPQNHERGEPVSFVPEPDWEDEDDEATDPATLYVDISEPSVVAILYDTKGEPLIELLDRDTVDFGYQPSGE